MQSIHVTRIIENVDFRSYRRTLPRLKGKISPGEAVVVFNKAKTRARLFDSAGGIYYMPDAPNDEEFDLTAVTAWIRRGLHVVLYERNIKRIAA